MGTWLDRLYDLASQVAQWAKKKQAEKAKADLERGDRILKEAQDENAALRNKDARPPPIPPDAT